MRFAAIAPLLLLPGTASAHIAMTEPTPRSVDQKAGPCGAAGSTRGSNVTVFQPGETINVEWDETVEHPGHYRIAFAASGNNFQNPNNPGDDFPETMVEPITDKNGGHYSQQVTLPTEPCDNCTLQLVQVMTTNVPFNSFYFQCADITIAGDPVDPTNPPGGTDGGCSSTGGSGAGMLLIAFALFRRRRNR
jgi:MYXO-CTERM domain-containing protein